MNGQGLVNVNSDEIIEPVPCSRDLGGVRDRWLRHQTQDGIDITLPLPWSKRAPAELNQFPVAERMLSDMRNLPFSANGGIQTIALLGAKVADGEIIEHSVAITLRRKNIYLIYRGKLGECRNNGSETGKSNESRRDVHGDSYGPLAKARVCTILRGKRV